ncbi:MAG: TlpA family protein disulfide reductase [Deltaproteobacteria bacterium]|nr:TlpA family protein disulfide reductase [Deltaproteobacteria bacterium]
MNSSSSRFLLSTLVLVAAAGCSPRNGIERPTVGEGDCEESQWPATPNAFDEYVGAGAAVGEKLGEWSLLDQHGCRTDSSQFLGAVTMIDISSVWCGPCNEAAATSMEVFEAIRARNRASWLLTVLVQDEFAGPAGVSDAEEWSEDYGITYPVVVDEAESVRADYGVISFPVFLFVAPDGEVYERIEGKPEDAEILDLMEFGLEEWASELRPEDEIPEPDLAEPEE